MVENQLLVEKSAFGSVNSAFGWSNQLLYSHTAPAQSPSSCTVTRQQHRQQSAGKGSNQQQENGQTSSRKTVKPAAGKWSNQQQVNGQTSSRKMVKPAAENGQTSFDQ
ncbi:Ethylene response factor 1 [Dorcoceras hygrometricum]|uniref:Ethylene response factor 1 n=1 Tax=Dorcoceras hygrometricum TaxID=472368 RepID=A0A2Z7CNC0_9LAMI|nr:Ethylene response factor 1 [Dorcoceras hygrometricum]